MGKRVRGILVAMITPFKRNGEVHVEGLRSVVEWLERGGVQGLFPNSSTGEALRMKSEERILVAEKTMEYASSNMLVTPGVTGNTINHAVEEARKMQDIGVDGIVIIPPFYYRLSPEALEEFYTKVVDRVDLPVILYNIPSASCNKLSLTLVKKLSDTGRVLAIKDSGGNLSYTARLITLLKGEVPIMQGSETLLLSTLVLGGGGGVLGLANVAPKLFVGIYENFVQNRLDEALRLQRLAFALLDAVYRGYSDTFFSNVKYALREIGVDAGYPRPPYRNPSSEERNHIRNVIAVLKEKDLL